MSDSRILSRGDLRDLVLRIASEGAGVIGPSAEAITHDAALRELVAAMRTQLHEDGHGDGNHGECHACDLIAKADEATR